MKVALASQSGKKIEAVKLAFADVSNFELITIKAPSGVNEQPIDNETFEGASNRIAFTKAACPDADLYISIENGLFLENQNFVDRAVVTIESHFGTAETTLSDEVVFPTASVEKTSNRDGGFVKWTVGKTMAEDGIVKDDADPHLCLSGKSRVEFLNETTVLAVKKLGL